jgi:ATP/maltotriose-dependent transcriptional regulator MalT
VGWRCLDRGCDCAVRARGGGARGRPETAGGDDRTSGSAGAYVAEITPGLLERGSEIEQQLGLELDYWASPSYGLARVLIRLGEVDRARPLLAELEKNAAAHGDEIATVMVLWGLSMLEWLAGRWPLALERAIAAYELGEHAQHPHGRLWIGRIKALVEADLGLIEQARLSAQEGLEYARASNEFATIVATGVLGRIELMRGNLPEAAAYLGDLPDRLLAAGLNEPTAPVWADAIETLIAVGELERARACIGPYETNSRKIRSPWALAGAARCRGLLAAAEGDLDGALVMLELATAPGSRVGVYPLERARTMLSLGMLRRQALQKKAAREALKEAIRLCDQLGARLWAGRARAELARISGRRAGGDELTETERRVAGMAAEGLSNKQIASALFMGVSTVEAHLSRAYRKLGVRSRAALASRLAPAADHLVRPVDEAGSTSGVFGVERGENGS